MDIDSVIQQGIETIFLIAGILCTIYVLGELVTYKAGYIAKMVAGSLVLVWLAGLLYGVGWIATQIMGGLL